jgi:hypothetical protein
MIQETPKPKIKVGYAYWGGAGEFYTGIRRGDMVLVEDRGHSWGYEIQGVGERKGAWLSCYDSQFHLLENLEWVSERER